MSNDLAGKRALVTGAGMGIGRGIAEELARQGAAVVLHYAHSGDGAHEAAATIIASGGVAHVVQGDLAEVAACRQVVDDAADALGGLDLLVNNAGITFTAPFAETTAETFDHLFAVNIRGYFFCAQRALPYLEAGSDAAILNITSVHGAAGFPGHTAYAATKGAIIGFTRQLAIELADRRIRVNAIGPGLIEVPRYFEIPGYTSAQGDSMVPLGRIGRPADVGRAAAWLLSPAAGFVTGQVLFVDGGTNARMGLDWDQSGGHATN